MTPEQIAEYVQRLQQLRMELFCDVDAVPPEAEQHVILALDAMTTAAAHLRLAKICTMQGR